MPELMKGNTWRDRAHKMSYPAWVEIKHDEIRCHVIVDSEACTVKYLSYAGKPLHNMSRFDARWLALAKLTGVLEYDTGFEVNGNYNDSYRWVRSSKGVPPDLVDVRRTFLLFDLPTYTSEPFKERKNLRQEIVSQAESIDFYNLHLPLGALATSAASIDQMFVTVRDLGYEGLMVKSLEHTYKRGKRTDGWLKVKPENDADGIITALHEAVSEDGVPLGRTGSVTLRVEDGSAASPHGIAHDLGRDMHAHPEKYLGRWAEFKYMERDRQGGYRHPVFHRLREDKA